MAEFVSYLGFCVICDFGLLCRLPLQTCRAEVAPAGRSWAGWAYGERKLPTELLFFKLRRNARLTICISPPIAPRSQCSMMIIMLYNLKLHRLRAHWSNNDGNCNSESWTQFCPGVHVIAVELEFCFYLALRRALLGIRSIKKSIMIHWFLLPHPLWSHLTKLILQ